MKIVVRAQAKPVWHHTHAQTSDETLSSTVVLDQDVVLQPFERAVLRAKVVTSDLEGCAFRNVVINFATPNRVLMNTMFVEHTIATVGKTGLFCLCWQSDEQCPENKSWDHAWYCRASLSSLPCSSSMCSIAQRGR